MAQCKEEYSVSWSSLTEDASAPREREESEIGAEGVPSFESQVEGSTDVSDSLSQKPPRKLDVKLEDDDLRNKLNKDRRGNYRKRGGYSTRDRRPQTDSSRPKYTQKTGGLSPLRSPLPKSRRKSIMDLDNSNNFRFTKRNSSTPTDAAKRRSYSNKSPARHSRDKWIVGTDSASESEGSAPQTVFSDSESEDGTPMRGRNLSGNRVRQSWSRRRLQLPSENDSDEENHEKLPAIKEEDKQRLARRDKDIQYGKNTEAYKKYIEEIPREKRSGDYTAHPRTPYKYKKCSRRSWDSQVKIWKRRLHTWAQLHGLEAPRFEGQAAPVEKNDDLNGSKDSWASIVARGAVGGKSEDGSDCLDLDEEDDSFLDGIDVSLEVAEEINDIVNINDD